MGNTPRLGMPLIAASQSQKHVTHNEAIVLLDAIVQLSVIDSVRTAPAASAAEGDRYRVASGAAGAWAGWDLNIALWTDGAWTKLPPRKGWLCFDEAAGDLSVWNGTAWIDIADNGRFVTVDGAAAGELAKIGVNAAADNDNRFALKSNAALFSHDDVTPGSGHMRIAINKSHASKDAGVVLQDDYSTRATFGLFGDDDFVLKVSPDGSTFFSGVSVDSSTGHVGLNGFLADSNNGLGVKGTAFLFDAEADDCRFTFNKHTSEDDVALTFQSGYSARALIGLLGDDNFTFKVSANGSTYQTAMTINKSTGNVDFATHPRFSAWCNFGQNYSAGAWQSLFANNTRHNDQAAFASVSNVGVFTAPADGYFLFGLGATFESPGTTPTKMQIGLSVNNATPTSDTINSTGDAAITSLKTSCATTALLKLASGDTVRGKIFFTTNDGRVLADENYFWGTKIA